jgi:hypothetical protein
MRVLARLAHLTPEAAAQRIRQSVFLHGNVFRWTPLIVYQMAKVGSSAIVKALSGSRVPLFHVHRMNAEHLHRMREERRARGWSIPPVPPHDRLGIQLASSLMATGGRARIVTLVRDPIARNFSSYFEHIDAIWHTPHASESIDLDRLCAGFLERFTHAEPLTWFDDELRPVFGVDVYEHAFPPAGHLTIHTDRFDLLVLKAEASDETKGAALSQFLGTGRIVVERANVTPDKTKGDLYRRFLATIRLSAAYVEEMLSARYTRHFYSEAEREAMRRSYLAEPSGRTRHAESAVR